MSFGTTIKDLRVDNQLSLQNVEDSLSIDQAIISKIERGKRTATRDQVLKFATFFKVDKDTLLISWLSDKLVEEAAQEDIGLKALQLAEEQVAYNLFKKVDRKEVLKKIKKLIQKIPQVEKAWIYGSFAREDDGPKSDVDIALQTNSAFSYFDLAEVQHQLENSINRKIDIGFIDSFKPDILAHIKLDLKLIYERLS